MIEHSVKRLMKYKVWESKTEMNHIYIYIVISTTLSEP